MKKDFFFFNYKITFIKDLESRKRGIIRLRSDSKLYSFFYKLLYILETFCLVVFNTYIKILNMLELKFGKNAKSTEFNILNINFGSLLSYLFYMFTYFFTFIIFFYWLILYFFIESESFAVYSILNLVTSLLDCHFSFKSYIGFNTPILVLSVLFIIILLLLIPEKNKELFQNAALISSIFILFLSYITIFKKYLTIGHLYRRIDHYAFILDIAKGKQVATFDLMSYIYTDAVAFFGRKSYKWFGLYNISYSIGFDGISVYFILLTTFITPFLILNCFKHITYMFKKLIILIMITEFLLLNVFLSTDLFFFYFFFESILIPMFLMIGIWGSRQRKIHAAYQFFFFTLVSSVLMLLCLIYIYYKYGSTEIEYLRKLIIPFDLQIIFWLCFMFSFAVKIPMFPFHIWLPEAHVEAPTVGSVLLAGLLLKMGTYGILRFLFPLFPMASFYFAPIIFVLGSLGIIYGSLTTIRQVDLKKIVAYSSVAHMNFVIVGLFSFNYLAIQGALLLMISHGLVSSAMFFAIGNLYERYKTRLLKYYGGLIQIMPTFGFFFIFFNLANMSFPGTNNFIGEFFILSGVFFNNVGVAIFISLNIVLSAIYSIWMVNRLLFGQLTNFKIYGDLNLRELIIFSPLAFLILYTGIKPQVLIDTTNFSVAQTIDFMTLKLNGAKYPKITKKIFKHDTYIFYERLFFASRWEKLNQHAFWFYIKKVCIMGQGYQRLAGLRLFPNSFDNYDNRNFFDFVMSPKYVFYTMKTIPYYIDFTYSMNSFVDSIIHASFSVVHKALAKYEIPLSPYLKVPRHMKVFEKEGGLPYGLRMWITPAETKLRLTVLKEIAEKDLIVFPDGDFNRTKYQTLYMNYKAFETRLFDRHFDYKISNAYTYYTKRNKNICPNPFDGELKPSYESLEEGLLYLKEPLLKPISIDDPEYRTYYVYKARSTIQKARLSEYQRYLNFYVHNNWRIPEIVKFPSKLSSITKSNIMSYKNDMNLIAPDYPSILLPEPDKIIKNYKEKDYSLQDLKRRLNPTIIKWYLTWNW